MYFLNLYFKYSPESLLQTSKIQAKKRIETRNPKQLKEMINTRTKLTITKNPDHLHTLVFGSQWYKSKPGA